MGKESKSICRSCGQELPKAIGVTDERPICSACRTRLDETPVAGTGFDETIITPGRNRADNESEPADTSGMRGDGSHAEEMSAFPLKIERFVIREVLGSGGFGTVYRAHDPLLDREVALKVPRLTDDDPAHFDRFLHEAKAAARLRHPNIVAIFECGVTGNRPYIASEFVNGTPLSEFRNSKSPDIRQAVEIVRQIAEAIDYAHSERIIHRDLKPANIMMSKSGRPQVMDFGLAKFDSDSERSMTSEGMIVGTPAYMAPEQARGDKAAVGPLSDQYSVGVQVQHAGWTGQGSRTCGGRSSARHRAGIDGYFWGSGTGRQSERQGSGSGLVVW